MPATIDEMSDVACLQMGQTLDLSGDDIDVRALVHVVAEEYIMAAGAPRVHVDAPTTGIVHGDRAGLRRVLQNVIDNAIKYCPQDVPVQVMVRIDDAGVMISIRDHGLGIPPADLPYIFARFYRASTAKGIRGTGIGLASATVIVEQHGGQIHATGLSRRHSSRDYAPFSSSSHQRGLCWMGRSRRQRACTWWGRALDGQ
jgi:signal transduction histidine kinase